MELCLFQGTFNPIHNAHIRVAKYVIDNKFAKKVIFVPAYNPPHKESDLTQSIHRYNMVKLAIKKYPNFEVSDIEFKRKGTSYTYLTIKELIEKYKPENKIKFIIGTDAFADIESWYKTEELKKLVDFLVFKRDNNQYNESIEKLSLKGYNFTLMDLDFKDISSSELRHKISVNESISEFLPKEAEDYIKKYELYKN